MRAEGRKRLVLATRNQHKVKEIKNLFGGVNPAPSVGKHFSVVRRCGVNLELLSLTDFPALPEIKEDGKTFRENAVSKAVEAAKRTGCIAMADDSGLEVYALGGKPGVRSARFAGEKVDYAANNKKLLKLMRHLPEGKRGARFCCAIAIAEPGGEVHVAEGTCEGQIALEPKGANGFGYDPVFLDTASGKTFAELSLLEKNRLSHRSKALSKAKDIIARIVEKDK